MPLNVESEEYAAACLPRRRDAAHDVRCRRPLEKRRYAEVKVTVDDAPGYDGADYVESDTVGHVDLWEYGDLGSTPQAIHAVQLVTAMQKTDAGTREARAVLKSGTTTANGATRQLSTSWQQFEDLHETDPDTGAAWTEVGVKALQCGAEVVT